ncbi:unnamed protein product [Rotaria sp. Silwood2]|nr:unnamed protein product [Rotaria sp. Silwood2]
MSFNNWQGISCLTCDPVDRICSWVTSISQCCYLSSVASIFKTNYSNSFISSDPFVKAICKPNRYLMVKDQKQTMYCYNTAFQELDIICLLENYDKNYCKCQ